MYGEANAPALAAVQATLSAKGSQLGLKTKDSRNKVSYRRFPAGPGEFDSEFSGSSELRPNDAAQEQHHTSGHKSRPRLKAKRDRGAADKFEAQAAMRSKLDEILARPLSAFTLFGLAQRGVLKKQKSSASVKEIVKVVGVPRTQV